jgi:hypothetical protein
MPTGRIRLVHWNATEAKQRARKLRAAGYVVSAEPFGPDSLRALRARPPAAAVIDLTRLPAQGRDVGLGIRHSTATRHVPLVFVAGEPDKVERMKRMLPDAEYTSWSSIRSALKRAIANPPKDPVVPDSSLAGYSGTPLVTKLGIRRNATVALVNAPERFEQTLGRLPEGVVIRKQARGTRDLTIWFVKSRKDLERRISSMASAVKNGGLWIVWPKKASGVASNLSQADVRRVGLDSGLVDYKISAIDATWSGLKFATRKSR